MREKSLSRDVPSAYTNVPPSPCDLNACYLLLPRCLFCAASIHRWVKIKILCIALRALQPFGSRRFGSLNLLRFEPKVPVVLSNLGVQNVYDVVRSISGVTCLLLCFWRVARTHILLYRSSSLWRDE